MSEKEWWLCLQREWYCLSNRHYCYNPKLGLYYNLGKDLSKNKGDNQLVKHQDIELYL